MHGAHPNPKNRPRFGEGSQFFTKPTEPDLFSPNRTPAAIRSAGRHGRLDAPLIELARLAPGLPNRGAGPPERPLRLDAHLRIGRAQESDGTERVRASLARRCGNPAFSGAEVEPILRSVGGAGFAPSASDMLPALRALIAIRT